MEKKIDCNQVVNYWIIILVIHPKSVESVVTTRIRYPDCTCHWMCLGEIYL